MFSIHFLGFAWHTLVIVLTGQNQNKMHWHIFIHIYYCRIIWKINILHVFLYISSMALMRLKRVNDLSLSKVTYLPEVSEPQVKSVDYLRIHIELKAWGWFKLRFFNDIFKMNLPNLGRYWQNHNCDLKTKNFNWRLS